MDAAALRAPNDLVLRVMPPRVPRDLVRRPRLELAQPAFESRAALVIEAPAGFGKTLLLAQWRGELLAQGVAVAWLTAPPDDDPGCFLRALVLAVRTGAARPRFAQGLFEAPPEDPIEGVTAWLADVAQASVQVALVIDEAEQLARPLHPVVTYLLRNAPPNLRCIVAVRGRGHDGIDEMVAYGSCLKLSAMEMRFTLDESCELARLRFGARFDPDVAARVHAIAEGWPLGVQLALTAAQSAHGTLPQLDLHGGALARQFVGVLLHNLAPAEVAFIARVSIVDELHPELAQLLTGDIEAPAVLRRLLRTAPIFTLREQRPWLRMHSLAREAIRADLHALPAGELERLHAIAADWLAGRGLTEAAARHALASGQHAKAYDLAERGLHEAMIKQGRQVAVQQWLSLVPRDELDRRPRLMLAGAWSLAASEHHAEAGRLVDRILQSDPDEAVRCECALIRCAAAVFADDPDLFAGLLAPWEPAHPRLPPDLERAFAYRMAYRHLLGGEPGVARLHLQQQHAPSTPGYQDHWGAIVVALCYLQEGQVRAARDVLAPRLAQAEELMGRRSSLACTQAVALAEAVHDCGEPEAAAALLADRLDVISRHCGPDAIVRGYRVLSRVAIAGGREERAIELLTQLDAVGKARSLPRAQLASACELVRVHARSFRGDTCRSLCEHIERLMLGANLPQGPIWRRAARLAGLVAAGQAALAQEQWRVAAALFGEAHEAALQARQTRIAIETTGLRAFAADRCGEDAGPLAREAAQLAQSLGLQRLFVDVHPGVDELLRRSVRSRAPAVPWIRVADAAARPPSLTAALTQKEREVLELAARSLSNKEIGRALGVGEETVKWHMKNVFAKLDTGTRKQAVAKARMFGLVGEPV